MKYYATIQSKEFLDSAERFLYADISKAREGKINFSDFKHYDCYPIWCIAVDYNYKDKLSKEDFWSHLLFNTFSQMKTSEYTLLDFNNKILSIIALGDFIIPTATYCSYAIYVKLLPYIDKYTIIFQSKIELDKENNIKLGELGLKIPYEKFVENNSKQYSFYPSYIDSQDFSLDFFPHIKKFEGGVKVKIKDEYQKDSIINVPKNLLININDKGCTYEDSDSFVGCIKNGDVYEEIISANKEEYEEVYCYLKDKGIEF